VAVAVRPDPAERVREAMLRLVPEDSRPRQFKRAVERACASGRLDHEQREYLREWSDREMWNAALVEMDERGQVDAALDAKRLARRRGRARGAFVAHLRETGQHERADRIEAINDTTGAAP